MIMKSFKVEKEKGEGNGDVIIPHHSPWSRMKLNTLNVENVTLVLPCLRWAGH